MYYYVWTYVNDINSTLLAAIFKRLHLLTCMSHAKSTWLCQRSNQLYLHESTIHCILTMQTLPVWARIANVSGRTWLRTTTMSGVLVYIVLVYLCTLVWTNISYITAVRQHKYLQLWVTTCQLETRMCTCRPLYIPVTHTANTRYLCNQCYSIAVVSTSRQQAQTFQLACLGLGGPVGLSSSCKRLGSHDYPFQRELKVRSRKKQSWTLKVSVHPPHIISYKRAIL